MEPITVAALLLGAVLLKRGRMEPPIERDEVVQVIAAAARNAKVPVHIALAFADVESSLNPTAEGDLTWPTRDGGRLYRTHVLGNARLAANPAKHDVNAWHSYGLFQLLAPYHVQPKEHPAALLDPRVNAERGTRFIANLLERAQGDIVRARLAYIGCGFDGERCSAENVARARKRIEQAIAKWNLRGVA